MLGHELGLFNIDAPQESVEEVDAFLEEKAVQMNSASPSLLPDTSAKLH